MRSVPKFAIGVALIIALSIVPVIEVEVVPTWRFQLVERDGTPLAGQTVRQYWKHFSFEWNWFAMNEATAVTDSTGFIEFPKRTITISCATWLIGSLWARLPLLNPHIEDGPFSFIQCDNLAGCDTTYKKGRELPTKVIREP
jgi:hypothetical protein